MNRILQELYRGMINPWEEYQPTEAYRRERKRFAARQEALLEKLHKTDPDACCEIEAMIDAENAAQSMELEEIYVQGMRMGARLALALLGEKAV